MFSTLKICELLFILVKIRDIDIVGRKETFSVLIIFVNLNILFPFFDTGLSYWAFFSITGRPTDQKGFGCPKVVLSKCRKKHIKRI